MYIPSQGSPVHSLKLPFRKQKLDSNWLLPQKILEFNFMKIFESRIIILILADSVVISVHTFFLVPSVVQGLVVQRLNTASSG